MFVSAAAHLVLHGAQVIFISGVLLIPLFAICYLYSHFDIDASKFWPGLIGILLVSFCQLLLLLLLNLFM